MDQIVTLINITTNILNITAIVALILFINIKEEKLKRFYDTKIKKILEKTERIEKMIISVPDTFSKIFIETPEKIEHGIYVKVHHMLNYIIHGKK